MVMTKVKTKTSVYLKTFLLTAVTCSILSGALALSVGFGVFNENDLKTIKPVAYQADVDYYDIVAEDIIITGSIVTGQEKNIKFELSNSGNISVTAEIRMREYLYGSEDYENHKCVGKYELLLPGETKIVDFWYTFSQPGDYDLWFDVLPTDDDPVLENNEVHTNIIVTGDSLNVCLNGNVCDYGEEWWYFEEHGSQEVIYGTCAQDEPLFCDNGNLITNCQECGCPLSWQGCQPDGTCALRNISKVLDPNHAMYPDSSLVDFSYLLDPPAGKHGFLEISENGNFIFEDGQESKFFGMMTMIDSPFRDAEYADAKVASLKRAGINHLRITSLDNGDRLFDGDYQDTQHYDYENWDKLDYFFYKLKEAGIYIKVDLLMDRQFLENDGVVNASQLTDKQWLHTGIVMFDRTLIDLQKKFAYDFLNHVNPYTDLAYKDDPSFVLVEVANERTMDWAADSLQIEPYRSNLKSLWNDWLLDKYGSTINLNNSWKHYDGSPELGPDEILENKSIELASRGICHWGSEYMETLVGEVQNLNIECSSARINDSYIFYSEIEIDYFTEMSDYVKNTLGYQGLVTSSGNDNIRSIQATSESLGINAPHGYNRASREMISLGNSGKLDQSWLARVASQKTKNTPLETGEGGLTPSETGHDPLYRFINNFYMAAYASLQEYDMITIYHYEDYVSFDNGEPRANTIDIDGTDMHSDPINWGLMAIANKMYISKDVSSAKYTIDVAYSANDTNIKYWPIKDIYKLASVSKIQNTFFDQQYDSDPDVDFTVSGGLSAGAGYIGENNMIYSLSPYNDPSYQNYGWTTDEASGYDVALLRLGCNPCQFEFEFDGIIFDKGVKKMIEIEEPYFLKDVENKGYIPIGRNETKDIAFGFYDPIRENFVFNNIAFKLNKTSNWNSIVYEQDDQKVRLMLDALGKSTGDTNISHEMIDDEKLVSDTGELSRDVKNSLFTIDTDKTQAIMGEIFGVHDNSLLKIDSVSELGGITMTSLEDKNLDQTDSYVLKMVTRSGNTDQDFDNGYFGKAPILTYGEASTKSTQVNLKDQKIIEAFLINGTWELYKRGSKSYELFCDTPNITFRVYDDLNTVLVHYYDNPVPEKIIISSSPFVMEQFANKHIEFVYPDGAQYVELIKDSSRLDIITDLEIVEVENSDNYLVNDIDDLEIEKQESQEAEEEQESQESEGEQVNQKTEEVQAGQETGEEQESQELEEEYEGQEVIVDEKIEQSENENTNIQQQEILQNNPLNNVKNINTDVGINDIPDTTESIETPSVEKESLFQGLVKRVSNFFKRFKRN